MSRSGYSEDFEYQNLWGATVARATRGKRGQALLRDLVVSLDAMPVKRLIVGELIEGGEVCALGAVGIMRKISMEQLDPEDPDAVGKAFDIAPALAQEIVYMNDEQFDSQTPEERWTQMRRWALNQILSPKIEEVSP